MFNYDMQKASHFTSKADGEQTFLAWLILMGLEDRGFSFNVKTMKLYKGKPIEYRVTSWGCYQNTFGVWVVFIAYVFKPMKHTIQYSWDADENGLASGDARKFEWIS